MKKKKYAILLLFTIVILISYYFISQKKNKDELKKNIEKITPSKEETKYTSNIIENVKYVSKDSRGNEYIIEALQGEIDYTNPNIIYLKSVSALIKLKDANKIKIFSNYGRYNLNNYDTIFSKNVVIDYLDNEVKGNYLDFSLERNLMMISRDVVYTNLNNILKADVVEIDIETKNMKVFMYEDNKKVNIKSKNWYGNNQKI